MNRKKVIFTLALTGLITAAAAAGIYGKPYITKALDSENITVLAYKEAKQTVATGFQIDKYENLQSVAWLNNSEVLTLTRKDTLQNPDYPVPIQYCSIYNLNSKTFKDFKDVNIAEFIGVSPDKQFVLYREPKYIPEVGGEEWQKALDSGELFHHSIKILNLSTGEISDLHTEYNNKDAEYVWISPTKILANYFTKWSIIDMSGKIYAEDDYKVNKYDTPWISGTDIQDLGDSVEGTFYYSQWRNGKEGTEVMSMDVSTKEIKSIFYNQHSLHADKRGNTILIDNYTNNREISPGVYDRSFGAYVLDLSGEIKQDIKLPKYAGNFVLSPDGTKAAYSEALYSADKSSILKVISINTGEIKEIISAPGIKNISWDDSSTALSFTSSVTSLDRTGKEGNADENSTQRIGQFTAEELKEGKIKEKVDTYSVYFDN